MLSFFKWHVATWDRTTFVACDLGRCNSELEDGWTLICQQEAKVIENQAGHYPPSHDMWMSTGGTGHCCQILCWFKENVCKMISISNEMHKVPLGGGHHTSYHKHHINITFKLFTKKSWILCIEFLSRWLLQVKGWPKKTWQVEHE